MSKPLSNGFHIVWIYDGSLAVALDAATWLKTVEALRNFGWRVTLLAAGPAGLRQIRGVEVLCIARPEIYLLRQIAFHLGVLLVVARQWASIDAILFHEMSAAWVLPLRLLRRLRGQRRPLLVMDSRTLPMAPPDRESMKAKIRRRVYSLANWLGNHYADGRLAITQRMAEAVHIPAEKLWGTWPSGADVDHFRQAQANRVWPGPDPAIHLIYHGSMHPERNLMTLCQAVRRGREEGMPFVLSLVGDGDDRANLERFAAQLPGTIRVLPAIPYAEIPAMLARAHVGVLPFPDEETFRVSSPVKLFEYMATGMPLLATRITCHTDVICGGDYVFWADEASEQGLLAALRVVWQSRDRLSLMGQHAAIAGQAWTWIASAEKLMSALQKGLQGQRSPTARISPPEIHST